VTFDRHVPEEVRACELRARFRLEHQRPEKDDGEIWAWVARLATPDFIEDMGREPRSEDEVHLWIERQYRIWVAVREIEEEKAAQAEREADPPPDGD